MRQAYHEQLDQLGKHGTQMCQWAADALRDATAALLTGDIELADKVLTLEAQLDQLRAHTEGDAVDLLARQAPVASDLRVVLTSLWIVADLQRMGSLALHVAKAAKRRHPAQVVPEAVRPLFTRMGSIGVHLAEQAQAVIASRDLDLARSMDAEDDLMDDLQRELFGTLLDPTWAHGVPTAVDLSLLGRFYERFADHAVAVSRRVIFLVTGENVGGDTTPALTAPES